MVLSVASCGSPSSFRFARHPLDILNLLRD